MEAHSAYMGVVAHALDKFIFMDKYKKIGWISGQVLIGVGFGLVGALLSVVIADLYFDPLDLFGIGMYALIGFYIGIPAGIGYDGFKLLKKLERQRNFYRFFIQCIIGTLIGIASFYCSITAFGLAAPHGLVNLLMIVLPLAGATIGFNFKFPYSEMRTGE